jgi:quercetin 2,3-dioxygenase
MNAVLRRGGERGHADHGWLKSFHSFSFADYYDPDHVQFSALRVINEDRVAPGRGFGTHAHRDMEILSYVLEGALAHEDSIGTGSTIRPGDVQRMSAGRGVTHSEFNPLPDRETHFLQIWITPDTRGLAPSYEQRHFPVEEKRGRLRLVASPDGAEGSVRIHQDARMHAGLFDREETARWAIAAGRCGYIHLARGRLVVDGQSLTAGDALMWAEPAEISFSAGDGAEVLVFDLPGDSR